ncbi:MAG: multidrug effflux MFS transporter [Novosphingobium sp.]|nr:multidrug effflux MFS transporter [Novosphingobium sp.]
MSELPPPAGFADSANGTAFAAAAPAADSFKLGRTEFVTLMAMLMALQALACDAMLPAIGTMARELGEADPNRRQLVIGLFLLASGLGSLIPGTVADRVGRRPVVLTCLALYIVLSLACALVTSFNALLFVRILLGLACSGLVVMPGAIVRDRFSGDTMARMSSTISSVFMIVPILAPSVGQAVLLFAGWRWIFAILGVFGSVVGLWAAFRLPETLSAHHRQPATAMQLLGNMREAATDKRAMGYVIGSALVFGALLGYINSSQQLVAEHFGAGPLFPLLFGGSAVMMSMASFTNSRIVERFGARRVSHTALLLFIGTSALQLLLASRAHETLWQFMPVMAVNLCLLGFIGANFGSIALQPFARIAGAASSVQAFVRMVTGSLLGIYVGQSFDGSARPLAMALLACGLVALALVLFSEDGKLFRRLNPPGSPRPVPGTPPR